jgi:hypothetical protein
VFQKYLKKNKKILFFSLLQINMFLMFLNHFLYANIKNDFLKIKNIYYFNIFLNKKIF